MPDYFLSIKIVKYCRASPASINWERPLQSVKSEETCVQYWCWLQNHFLRIICIILWSNWNTDYLMVILFVEVMGFEPMSCKFCIWNLLHAFGLDWTLQNKTVQASTTWFWENQENRITLLSSIMFLRHWKTRTPFLH